MSTQSPYQATELPERKRPAKVDYMLIATRIRALRENSGMTQYGLAKVSCITPSQLSDYECGRRIPRFDTIAKICAVTGWSADAMLGIEKESK